MLDAHPKKYLGLPSLVGRSKKQIFNEVKERVGKKLMGWKEKNAIHRWKGDSDKRGSPGYTNIYNGMFLAPKRVM